jgi:hypothetical protein
MSGHVGFVVDKVTLGQVFSEYFGFPCQFSFRSLPNGISLTPPQEIKRKLPKNFLLS